LQGFHFFRFIFLFSSARRAIISSPRRDRRRVSIAAKGRRPPPKLIFPNLDQTSKNFLFRHANFATQGLWLSKKLKASAFGAKRSPLVLGFPFPNFQKYL
jgi:hypothetical protein